MIYLDCGFYMGTLLQRLVDNGTIDKTWTIYAFEPNPDLAVKQKVKDFFGDLNIKLIPEAVWTEDGTLPFHISGREDAAGVAGLTGHTEPKEVTVKSMDFSKFVSKLPDEYIYCSMDIEGGEFVVLEKMLADNTIDKIDFLDIEFHHRLMNDYTKDDALELVRKILNRGVGIKLKVAME